MKKIYFACSIRGGRQDQPVYDQLVNMIRQEAEVLSEIFGDKSLTDQGHSNLSDKRIYERDINWIKSADGVIAEVTNPSLGVGYELAKAEEWNIPVLALFRQDNDRRLSAMIAGSPNLTVINYQDPAELKSKISSWLKNLDPKNT